MFITADERTDGVTAGISSRLPDRNGAPGSQHSENRISTNSYRRDRKQGLLPAIGPGYVQNRVAFRSRLFHRPEATLNRTEPAQRLNLGKSLAGVVGLEPTVHDTKNRCLTIWLHPNRAALDTRSLAFDQDQNSKKSSIQPSFLRGLLRQKIIIRGFGAFGVNNTL